MAVWQYTIVVEPIHSLDDLSLRNGQYELTANDKQRYLHTDCQSEQSIDAACEGSRNSGSAFDASFTDGWDRTHAHLFFENDNQADSIVRDLWKEFIQSNELVISSEIGLDAVKAWMEHLRKNLSCQDMCLNEYALELLCLSLQIGCEFALAISGQVKVSCNCIGPTRDDREFI